MDLGQDSVFDSTLLSFVTAKPEVEAENQARTVEEIKILTTCAPEKNWKNVNITDV